MTFVQVNEVKRKLQAGEQITAEDIKIIREYAASSGGNPDLIRLFGTVRAAYMASQVEESATIPKQTEEERAKVIEEERRTLTAKLAELKRFNPIAKTAQEKYLRTKLAELDAASGKE